MQNNKALPYRISATSVEEFVAFTENSIKDFM
jgi:hypothetical protein